MHHAVGYYDAENPDKAFATAQFAMWSVDEQYDSFEVDPLEWLTVAGEIANEKASNDVEAFDIWRDYQYQVSFKHRISLKISKTFPTTVDLSFKSTRSQKIQERCCCVCLSCIL